MQRHQAVSGWDTALRCKGLDYRKVDTTTLPLAVFQVFPVKLQGSSKSKPFVPSSLRFRTGFKHTHVKVAVSGL